MAKTRKTLEWALIAGGVLGALGGAYKADECYTRGTDYLKTSNVSTISQLPEEGQNYVIGEYVAGNQAFSLAFLSGLTGFGGVISKFYHQDKEFNKREEKQK